MSLRFGALCVVSGAFLSMAGCSDAADESADLETRSLALLTDPSLVKPVLECVTQEDATHFTAYFGYSNTVADDVSVPVGANN